MNPINSANSVDPISHNSSCKTSWTLVLDLDCCAASSKGAMISPRVETSVQNDNSPMNSKMIQNHSTSGTVSVQSTDVMVGDRRLWAIGARATHSAKTTVPISTLLRAVFSLSWLSLSTSQGWAAYGPTSYPCQSTYKNSPSTISPAWALPRRLGSARFIRP